MMVSEMTKFLLTWTILWDSDARIIVVIFVFVCD